MKKQKKTHIIFLILAAVFAVGIPGSFREGIAAGIVCLLLTALFAYLGFKKSPAKKQTTPKAVSSPAPVKSQLPEDQARKDRDAAHVSFIENKQQEFSTAPSHVPCVDIAVFEDRSMPDNSISSVLKPVQEIKPAADPERTEREAQRAAYLDGQRKEFSNALAAIPRADIYISEDKVTRQAPSNMPEIHFTNITKRTHIDKLFPLVVIDTETTGLTPRGNDIIEVSAIRYEEGFVPVSCFTTLLRSRNPIPAEASSKNNITDDMIKDKPFFSEIAASFSDYISGCNVVGHNLPFDLKFLFVCGATLSDKAKYYDTYDLAKRTLLSSKSKKWDNEIGASVPVDDYDVEDYKLETLCDYYGIYRADAHRSLSDCFATAKVFERIIDDKMNKE